MLLLSGCSKVTTLKPLLNLKKLTELRLEGMLNGDLIALSKLRHLRTLSLIGFVGLSDLRPLAMIQTLEELHLINCLFVQDLNPLRNLKRLKILSINQLNASIFVAEILKKTNDSSAVIEVLKVIKRLFGLIKPFYILP